MLETVLIIGIFLLVVAMYLTNLHNREIRDEQNLIIEHLKGEARFLLKEHRRDIEMLDWADKSGYYDVRCDSLRDELRAAMKKDEQVI